MITAAREHIQQALHQLEYGEHDRAVQELIIALGNLGDADTEIGQLVRELSHAAVSVQEGAEVRRACDKQRDIRMEQRVATRLLTTADQLAALIPEQHHGSSTADRPRSVVQQRAGAGAHGRKRDSVALTELERRRAVQALGERAIRYYVDTGLCVFCDADDCAGKPHAECNVGALSGVVVDAERIAEKAAQRTLVDAFLNQ